MLKAYYFRHQRGFTLAPVYAKSEMEATILLWSQHKWCNANKNNTTLIKVEDGTEWERICN